MLSVNTKYDVKQLKFAEKVEVGPTEKVDIFSKHSLFG